MTEMENDKYRRGYEKLGRLMHYWWSWESSHSGKVWNYAHKVTKPSIVFDPMILEAGLFHKQRGK